MQILSKIFILILLLFTIHSFAKAKRCSQSQAQLVDYLNTVYLKQDGGIFYDLMSKKSALKIEKRLKLYLKRYVLALKRNKNARLNAKDRASLVYIRNLRRLKGRDFYRLLFKISMLSASAAKKPVHKFFLKGSKTLNGKTALYLSNAFNRKIALRLLKEEGCFKLEMSREQLSFFFFK